MNRIQFYILIGLSSLLVLLLCLNVYLSHKVGVQQAQAGALQQALTQGKDVEQKLTLLARRINVEAQKTPPDQTMKDILTKQQINFKNPDSATPDAPAAPATPSSTTR